MDTSDLRGRVVTLKQQANQREQRLVNLESWRQQQDINGARTDEKWNDLEARFTSLDGKITEIGSSLKYINRLVIAGLIGFMLDARCCCRSRIRAATSSRICLRRPRRRRTWAASRKRRCSIGAASSSTRSIPPPPSTAPPASIPPGASRRPGRSI